MKRFWAGLASSLALAGAFPYAAAATAEERVADGRAATESAAKDPATESRPREQSGERGSETPRSESPSQSQPVLPLRAGDRRGGAPVWIGAMCASADATLRHQLGLGEGVGLVVARVMPGSPADRAGLKVHDVVVAIDGAPVGDLAALMKAVESAGAEGLKLEIIRVGKKQSVVVVPGPRPVDDVLIRPGLTLPPGVGIDPQIRDEHIRRLQEEVDKLRGRLPEADEKRLQEWLDQMKRGENQPLRLQLFGPGLVMKGSALPDGVKVVIERSGDAPARVTVTRGTEKWEVTEKELDKLPEEFRETVRAMVEKD